MKERGRKYRLWGGVLCLVGAVIAAAVVGWKFCESRAREEILSTSYYQLASYAHADSFNWAIDNAVEDKNVEKHMQELTDILRKYEAVVHSNYDYMCWMHALEPPPLKRKSFAHIAMAIEGRELYASGYRMRPQAFAADGVLDEREKHFLLELQQDYNALLSDLPPGGDLIDLQYQRYWRHLDEFSQKWNFWNVKKEGTGPLNMDSPYFNFVIFDT